MFSLSQAWTSHGRLQRQASFSISPVRFDAQSTEGRSPARTSSRTSTQLNTTPLNFELTVPHSMGSVSVFTRIGRINGQDVSCLLDSGANYCFCSSDAVTRFGLHLDTSDVRNVRLANQSTQKTLGHTRTPNLTVDGIRWNGSFIVMPGITHHTFILGMPWLHDSGARIDFATRKIDYRSPSSEVKGAEHHRSASPRPNKPPLMRNKVRNTPDSKSPLTISRGAPEVSTANPFQVLDCESMNEHEDESRPADESPTTDDRTQEEILCHAEFESLNELSADFPHLMALHQMMSSSTEPPSPTDSADGRVSTSKKSEGPFAPGESEDKKQRLQVAKSLYQEFQDVFPDELPSGLPPSRSSDFEIKLIDPNVKPPSRAPYQMSVPESDQLKQDLEEWRRKGWIEISESPYGAPCSFVRKSDGTRRLVIDYRLLNQVTERDEAGLPLPDELFNRLAGARFFSKIDLRSGYYQCRIAPKDVPKTAFRCRFGHYQWRVLPFGLQNAPSFFMRIMNSALQPLLDSCCVCFLDDVLVYSRTLKEHKEHLRRVLQILREHKLYAKLQKCSLVASEVTFLGHRVSRHGFTMETSKTQAINEWPRPRTVRELRQFLGLCGFYRRYIQFFSAICVPLSNLLKKKGDASVKSNSKLDWNDDAERAFNTLKQAMQSAPTLIVPDHKKPFVLHCDASDFAIGASIGQEAPGEGVRPIGFMSRKLNPAETRYPTHDRELLAIVRALQAFRHLIDNSPVTIITDHAALQHFFTQPHLTSRQMRWALLLSQFNAKLRYEPGKTNIVADALSRRPDLQDDPNQTTPVFIDRSSPAAREYALAHSLELTGGHLIEEVVKAQKSDEFSKRIQADPRCVENSRLQLTPIEGVLMRGDLIYVPDDRTLKSKLLYEAHDSPTSGHGGVAKTIWLLSNQFWWPRMNGDIADYISRCNRCQLVKSSTRPPSGKLNPLPRPLNAWSDIGIDFIGPLPKTKRGHDAIMVVVDRSSKYGHFIPTTTKITGEDVWRLLMHEVVRLHGLPISIVSDRDTRFTGFFWQALHHAMNVHLRMSTSFHPATDGQTERLNRILEDYLRCYCSTAQDDWDDLLDNAELCYNNSYQSAIGTSPHVYVNGQRARTPLVAKSQQELASVPTADANLKRIASAQDTAQWSLDRALEHMQRTADKNRTDSEFQVGEQVLLDTQHLRLPSTSKLSDRFIGPFKILERIQRSSYRLELPDSWTIRDIINVSRLKRYKAPGHESFPTQPAESKPPPVQVEEGAPNSDHFEVETILKSRPGKGKKGETQYYVKWLGWPASDNSWVKSSDLNAPELIKEFEQRNQRRAAVRSVIVEDGTLTEEEELDQETSANCQGQEVEQAIAPPHDNANLLQAPKHPEMERVWQTTQCRAKTKSGDDCKRRTRRSVYCWQHLQALSNLRIKPSNIPGAGLGLWTGPKPFKKNVTVAEYTGPVVRDVTDEQVGGGYALQLSKNAVIAGGGSSNTGSFANDCRPTDRKQGLCSINTRLSVNPRTGSARLVSTKRIPPHTEVTASYGRSYWPDKEKQDRARAAAQSNTEIVAAPRVRTYAEALSSSFTPASQH